MFDRDMRASDICDVQSEAGVVASLILNPELSFYSEWLTPRHFTEQTNGYMYYALKELALKKIVKVDAYNIISVLKKDKTVWAAVEDMLDTHNINEFISEAPAIARSTPEEYKVIAENVKNAAFRRDVFQKLRQCEKMCFDETERGVGEQIYSALDNILLEYESDSELTLYKDVVDDIWKSIQAKQSGETGSIEFPFPLLNRYVVLTPGECCCVSAQTKAGKSIFLMTVCVDLLRKNKGVLVIDSEITTELYTMRILSHLTGIEFYRIRSGRYSKEEEKVIIEQLEWLKTRRFIHIYMPNLSANNVFLSAKKSKYLIDCDVLILDYIKADSGASYAGDAYSVYSELGNLSDRRVSAGTGMCLISYPLNCWKPVRPVVPQREDERCLSATAAKAERNGGIRIRSNPKCDFNRQSATKPRTGERSTTKYPASDWPGQRWASRTDEDIVLSLRRRSGRKVRRCGIASRM